MLEWLRRARRLEHPNALFGVIAVGLLVALGLAHFHL